MLGETHQSNPSTIHVPPWTLRDDPTAGMLSPHPLSPVSPTGGIIDYSPFLTALQRYLPSNTDTDSDISDTLIDTYSSDEFRMYDFKVRRCSRGRSHDWTECPYAHPGEKARRRDPLRYSYTGTACTEFRKGNCRRGDTCEFAHGVFECWLHPARYRTQPCKDGIGCRRRVCFFAHTPKQLRIATHQVIPRSSDLYDGSPLRHALDQYMSPTTTLSPPSDSPPMSPSNVNEVIGSMRRLRLSGAGSWGVVGSPAGSKRRPSGISSPTWNSCIVTDLVDEEEQPMMERVESGKVLRSKIFEKLSKENSVSVSGSVDPDVDWVSELIQ